MAKWHIMEQKQVLIPGGYGAVGSIIATLLSNNKDIIKKL